MDSWRVANVFHLTISVFFNQFLRGDMRHSDEVRALPLWIDGRAYLKLPRAFHDVASPGTGQILRRVPLCAAEEIDAAVQASRRANLAWAGMDMSKRQHMLAALGDALAGLVDHFARLIVEETGMDLQQAEGEVAKAALLFHRAVASSAEGVVAVLGGTPQTFFALVNPVVAALMAGAALIVCPSLEAPAVVFALAELSGRCGFPPGVLNVLYVDARQAPVLFARAGITLLSCGEGR